MMWYIRRRGELILAEVMRAGAAEQSLLPDVSLAPSVEGLHAEQ